MAAPGWTRGPAHCRIADDAGTSCLRRIVALGPAVTMIGFVVGLEAEAQIARRFGCPVAIGGGGAAGAAQAAAVLAGQGVTHLVSFGLAGGFGAGSGCRIDPDPGAW